MTLRNSKFTTTVQKRSNKDIETIFHMLNNQTFYLNIELIQTAFRCSDSFVISNSFQNLTISSCTMKINESILSLIIPLPRHEIIVRLALFGVKTIGAIRIGLTGRPAINEDKQLDIFEHEKTSRNLSLNLDPS